jgi:hypothetical protein
VGHPPRSSQPEGGETLSNLMPSTQHLWDKVISVSGLGLILGIYGIVYGLTAETFMFRSRSWWPGQERVRFTPSWRDRLLVVFAGLVVTITSTCSILGFQLRH